LVFVSRAGINVDTDAREGTRYGFAGDSDAIGQGRDLVEVVRMLKKTGVTKTEGWNAMGSRRARSKAAYLGVYRGKRAA
jgi:hypothetical protein